MWLKVGEIKSNIYEFITSRNWGAARRTCLAWTGLKQKISAIWQNTKFYLLQAFRGEKLLKSDNTGSVS